MSLGSIQLETGARGKTLLLSCNAVDVDWVTPWLYLATIYLKNALFSAALTYRVIIFFTHVLRFNNGNVRRIIFSSYGILHGASSGTAAAVRVQWNAITAQNRTFQSCYHGPWRILKGQDLME